jgi:hypothetical protein
MTRCPLASISLFCLTIAITSNTFGQARKYTESFNRDRQNDARIVETLQQLKPSHSKLKADDLLAKLNDWVESTASEESSEATLPKAIFRMTDDAIIMKVFWGEDVESKTNEWIQTEGMNHCFKIANDIICEWNKDRECQLVRFAGLELLTLPLDHRERELADGTKVLTVVASPEVVILLE